MRNMKDMKNRPPKREVFPFMRLMFLMSKKSVERSDKPLFRFKILAGSAEFDGAALGIAFALEAALQELDEKSEFVARLDAKKLPGDGNDKGTSPVGEQVGRRGGSKKNAVLAGFENHRDFAGKPCLETNGISRPLTSNPRILADRCSRTRCSFNLKTAGPDCVL